MVLRYHHHHLRNAVTLGTGLTALFLLARCSVPERDYTPLGIDENAGSGGGSGSGGDGTGGASAGQGGLGGTGGLGGAGGARPVDPIPCDAVGDDAGTHDAGATDAGATDAGITDAGTTDERTDNAACECVDGFIRAIDADGDGAGSRACSIAPGLDCDDDAAAVTHNSCGGCTTLPDVIGEDCLDCGSSICDGPDAVACASKPGPVVDPDCECVDGLLTARDTDGDGQGTRLCEANAGSDCNDGDDAFTTNACGGWESLPGTVGAACNVCGVYACNGTALACVPSTGAAGRRCLDATTRQTCVGSGYWDDTTCANVCYQGNCEICTPGTFRCSPFGSSTQVEICNTSSSTITGWSSYASCTPSETCNANTGTCTGYLLLPRDRTFDVVPQQRGDLPWHDVLNTAFDADYG